MKNKAVFLFCLGCVFLFIVGCGKQVSSSKRAPVKIESNRAKSLYFYLLSEFEKKQIPQNRSFFFLEQSIKNNQDSAYLLIEKSYQLADQKRFLEAIGHAQKAYQKNPQSVAVNQLLGKIYSSQGQRQKALFHYLEAQKAQPENEETYHLLAREYLFLDQIDAAIKNLNKILQLNPDATQALIYLANIYATQKKDYLKALALYQEALALEPQNPQINRQIAEVYLAQQNYPKALQALLLVEPYYPEEFKLALRIALLYYELAEFKEGLKRLEIIASHFPHQQKRLFYYLGLFHARLGNRQEAFKFLGKVEKESYYFSKAVEQTLALYLEEKSVYGAELYLDKLLPENSQNFPVLRVVTAFFISLNRPSDALKLLEAYQPSSKKNEAELFYLFSLVWQNLNQPDKALEYAEKSLRLNDNNPNVLNFVGYQYVEQNNNLGQAEKLLLKAYQLTLKKPKASILDSLGWLYFKKGHFTKSIDYLLRAYELAPNQIEVNEHLGKVYLKLKNKRKARYYFIKAMSLIQDRINQIRPLNEGHETFRLNRKQGQLEEILHLEF